MRVQFNPVEESMYDSVPDHVGTPFITMGEVVPILNPDVET
jgi:hypothetical protein